MAQYQIRARFIRKMRDGILEHGIDFPETLKGFEIRDEYEMAMLEYAVIDLDDENATDREFQRLMDSSFELEAIAARSAAAFSHY